jgi:hypothetical protein
MLCSGSVFQTDPLPDAAISALDRSGAIFPVATSDSVNRVGIVQFGKFGYASEFGRSVSEKRVTISPRVEVSRSCGPWCVGVADRLVQAHLNGVRKANRL